MFTAHKKNHKLSRRDAHPKPGFAVGLEFDHLVIRAARIALDGQGGQTVDGLVDVTGDFIQDAALIDGLRQVKDRLRFGARDTLATCLAGKQVSASQIAFRKLPPEEMESALRLEMRKSLPFEVAGATLDYQLLGDLEAKADSVQVLVALAGSDILSHQLKVFEKAGLTPAVVDVLPVAAGNALWNWVGAPKSDVPHVAIHIGPQISTIVIDGAQSPFFNRYVYFAAEDFVGKEPGSPDIERRVQSLADEVSRSLAFYEKSALTTGFQELLLLGEYLDTPALQDKLRRQTGMGVRRMDIPGKLGFANDSPKGRFDLAMALALRAGEAI